MLIDFPYPTSKHALGSNNFFAFSISFQIGEALFNGSFLSQSLWTFYLLLSSLIQTLSRFDATIHANLDNRAALESLFLLKPNLYPPWIDITLTKILMLDSVHSHSWGSTKIFVSLHLVWHM
jgi:hypothetical protein